MIARLAVPGYAIAAGRAPRTLDEVAKLRALAVTHWAHHGRKAIVPEVRDATADVALLLNPARDDGEPKPVEWYVRTLEFARDALAVDGSLLISCSRGHHRGPSVAYAVLRILLHMSPSEASARIREALVEAELRYADDVEVSFHALCERVGSSAG